MLNSTTLPLAPTRVGWLDQAPQTLRAWLEERRQPPMRLAQIQRWLFTGRASAFEQMTDLPVALRQELAQAFELMTSRVERRLTSSDGTEKLLLRLSDGQLVECVLLKERERRTVCLSTQVGCGMGCVFCASGLEGVTRNLTRGEILEQLLQARQLLIPRN
ncbi:MAG: 23S rRNA (adenine(2503)-C(2))-methyltransferase RlmN, partial [Gemmataceae bacterium]